MTNISIVIPFYEKAELFKKTWAALAPQIEDGDEIVVVDDHSPSGVGICECAELRVIQPPKLEPHIYRCCGLRNYGIEHAENDAILILDPDCIPKENLIENARRFFDPVVLFGGRIDFVEEDGSTRIDPRFKAFPEGTWGARNGSMIWGGLMLFSRRRTQLVGWFNSDYDGSWGPGEGDFANKCYHSGIRRRYEPKLYVLHQWHDRSHREGPLVENRRNMFRYNMLLYEKALNAKTPYNPAVGVVVVTTRRPYFVDQCMSAIFRNPVPLKVLLVNNGDQSNAQKNAIAAWKRRWAVEYVHHDSPQRLSVIRTDAMKWAAEKGYKYLVVVDDDIMVRRNALIKLIQAAEAHPEYHAIAGWFKTPRKGEKRFGGGYIVPEDNHRHYYLPVVAGVHEVDYIGTGIAIMRLNPLVPFDAEYEMGWNDWDWANEVKRRGLRLAVCGEAGAYHKYLFTSKGPVFKEDPPSYQKLRRDKERHSRMADRFESKWGYRPRDASLWKGELRSES